MVKNKCNIRTRHVTYKQILITVTTWQDSSQASPAGGKHTHTVTQNIKDKTDGVGGGEENKTLQSTD